MIAYVVGAGAVGRFLGERLRSERTEIVYAPRALEDVVPVEAGLAIVAVKSYDTAGAIATLRAALGQATEATILCVQNGVGNEELLAAAFGPDAVVAGALTIPVALAQDGPHASAAGGLGLAPVGGVAHNWLVAACERAAIETRVAADYRALKWSKLALNLVANAACAILDVAPARLVALEGALALELRALRETFAVMAAQELRTLDLPRYPVNLLRRVVALPTPLASALLARRFAAARSGKLPSLLLDLRAGRRRTEIDALCGAVVAAGRRHAIPTPVNATYQRLVNDLTAEPALRERYRGRIDLLCSEVERETNRRLA